MPTFSYSKQAERDLDGILAYTKQQWGIWQAEVYFQELADTFHLLARYPGMGRVFSENHPNWRRFETESHVIVYTPAGDGIRVQRLIHQRQLVTAETKLI